VNVNLHYLRIYIFDNTKEGNEKHRLCQNPNVKFISMRWAAKPEKDFKDNETMAQGEGEKLNSLNL
jgi:hypothetical protein